MLVAMASLSLTLGALFGERGFLEALRYGDDRSRLEADIAALESEVAALEAEVASLRTDPFAIERLAREELDLAFPDEILVFVDDPAQPSRDPRREWRD